MWRGAGIVALLQRCFSSLFAGIPVGTAVTSCHNDVFHRCGEGRTSLRCCNDVFHRCSRGFPREQRLLLATTMFFIVVGRGGHRCAAATMFFIVVERGGHRCTAATMFFIAVRGDSRGNSGYFWAQRCFSSSWRGAGIVALLQRCFSSLFAGIPAGTAANIKKGCPK
ncbi:hypothetical protein [Paenibacillus aceris]|uniref:Secreted protein n=1 Tax=Paenibacillus aceris TaxID=869555 RepID=A0ABS4HY68_9BACL|nr:hypothetical protein [Paenibacillus aceris]MBP1963580.1 hypothetical protein [Paenibacillus aceris]